MEKIRVLMIDDNTSLVEMVKEYFTGHKKIEVTLTCKDGEEGLETIISKSSEYDIIFLLSLSYKFIIVLPYIEQCRFIENEK